MNRQTESILDPTYVNIQYLEVKWNTTHYIEEPLPSHPCSDAELGLEPSKGSAEYMKPHPYYDTVVNVWKKKFVCIDSKDRYVHGNFNTEKARNIRVRLNRCRGQENNCKTDDEITEFVKGKYMIVYMNQIRFDDSKYGAESIVKESRADWYRIRTKAQDEYPYLVK